MCCAVNATFAHQIQWVAPSLLTSLCFSIVVNSFADKSLYPSPLLLLRRSEWFFVFEFFFLLLLLFCPFFFPFVVCKENIHQNVSTNTDYCTPATWWQEILSTESWLQSWLNHYYVNYWLTLTTLQPFYGSLDFVQDYPVSWYQKDKTKRTLDFLEQETVSGSWIS